MKTCDLEPILATNEAPLDRNESSYKEKYEYRKMKDDQILHIVWKINQNILKLSTDLAEIETKIKRKLYESPDVYIAVAKVKMDAHTWYVRRQKFKAFRIITQEGKRNGQQAACCATIPLIKQTIHSEVIKHIAWEIELITISLAVTHFPCEDCLEKITDNLHEVKPILILSVANILYESNIVVDWLFKLHCEGLTVKLQPIRVVEAQLNANKMLHKRRKNSGDLLLKKGKN